MMSSNDTPVNRTGVSAGRGAIIRRSVERESFFDVMHHRNRSELCRFFPAQPATLAVVQ
jgi:hypothetical protein